MTGARCLIGALLLGAILVLLLGVGAPKPASAQSSPFGIARPDSTATAPGNGVFGWIAGQQSKFYRALSSAIRRTREDGSAVWLLVGLSFAYGVFHAAGPGHGKAVISSYIVSTGETLRRGLMLSTAAALLQAMTAIALVLTLTLALRATSTQMAAVSFQIEAASYLVMAMLGAWLVYRKAGAFLGIGNAARMAAGSAHPDDCGCIVPGADAVARIHDWRGAAGAVFAVGVRPCTGALVVLVFAIAQGLLWAGVLATFAMAAGTAITVGAIAALAVLAKAAALRLADHLPGSGSRVIAGIEVLAAGLVLALALLLLGGLYAGGSTGG